MTKCPPVWKWRIKLNRRTFRASRDLGTPIADLDEGSRPTEDTATLHAAMLKVIAGRPEGMTARELATEVNRRGLYKRRDGRALDAVQIRARAGQYSSLFARREGRIFVSDQSLAAD